MAEPHLSRNPSVVSTEMEDGLVLRDVDTTRYDSLDRSGLEIWKLLDACARSRRATATAP